MIVHDKVPIGSRKKSRFWLKIALFLIVVGCIFWPLLKYLINVDSYGPEVVEALQEATGLPAQIGEMDLLLFPRPHVKLEQLILGQDDFRAELPRIKVYPKLMPLLSGTLHINLIEVDRPIQFNVTNLINVCRYVDS